ncbi:hypothetical protein LXL04_000891 [Taraxacum kok-saghyz]
MIARINKIPLSVIDRLKWDLGLPNDYTQTIVPQFPDYFQVDSSGDELELVCWSDYLKWDLGLPFYSIASSDQGGSMMHCVSGLKMEKMVVVDFGVGSVKG